jgi:lipid-A-disaccharide synthase
MVWLTMATDSPVASSLIIVGNGPGEIAGWAVPIAAEARQRAARDACQVEIVLCLPPCQFASGQEHAAAEAAGVFDRILDPRDVLRLVLGLRGWMPAVPPVVLHVGGDFWYTRRLARRWRAPAYAFVERAHVARVHRHFRSVFVPTAELEQRLIRYGVPADKISVTGDPRYDAVLSDAGVVTPRPGNGATPTITFLPGSRDTVFTAVFPFWVETAAALRRQLPDARLQTVISPFVSPSVRSSLVAEHHETLAAAGLEVGTGGWPRVVGSDLVLTIPGTNTLELAILRIPSLVVLPFSLAPQIPFEGIIEWITRIPYLGPMLRLQIARSYVRRVPYVALPNMRAGRRIMPELIGTVTPQQVAAESARLIRDEPALAALARALEAIPRETGASRRILDGLRAAPHPA